MVHRFIYLNTVVLLFIPKTVITSYIEFTTLTTLLLIIISTDLANLLLEIGNNKVFLSHFVYVNLINLFLPLRLKTMSLKRDCSNILGIN